MALRFHNVEHYIAEVGKHGARFQRGKDFFIYACNITSKVNGTPKGVYLPISKLHSILAVANLLAHNILMVMLLWALRLKSSVVSK